MYKWPMHKFGHAATLVVAFENVTNCRYAGTNATHGKELYPKHRQSHMPTPEVKCYVCSHIQRLVLLVKDIAPCDTSMETHQTCARSSLPIPFIMSTAFRDAAYAIMHPQYNNAPVPQDKCKQSQLCCVTLICPSWNCPWHRQLLAAFQ